MLWHLWTSCVGGVRATVSALRICPSKHLLVLLRPVKRERRTRREIFSKGEFFIAPSGCSHGVLSRGVARVRLVFRSLGAIGLTVGLWLMR